MGLNSAGSLTCGFLSAVNTAVLHSLKLVESMDTGGIVDTEGYYKLY